MSKVVKGVKNVFKSAAPIIGGAAGFMMGGPAGAAVGLQLGGAVSGAMQARDDEKAAKSAMAQGDYLAAQQLGLARDQFEFERGMLVDDRKIAADDFSRRLGIADEMMAAATFSPGFYDQQIGSATATVRGTMDQAREAEMRQMGRYGINPASGRFADASARYSMATGLAEASAANQTRSALGAEERSRKDAARVYGLQVTPMFPGRAVNNPAIDVLGQQAGHHYGLGVAKHQQAASGRAGVVDGLFTLGGTILGNQS